MPSRLLALFICLFSIQCLAANKEANNKNESVRIYLYGARDVSECTFETNALLEELRSFHYPPGWTVGIVCTSLVWEEVRQRQDLKPYTKAFTYFSAKTTVFNGAIFHEIRNEYRHIVAHELGHIKCECKNEDTAEKFAAELEKQSRLNREASKTSESTQQSTPGQ